MSSPFATAVIEDMEDIIEGGLTTDQFTKISQEVAKDAVRLGEAEPLYFVIGNYSFGRGQKHRVMDVRHELSITEEAPEAFILEDIDPDDEAWENWYTKFLIFKRRADFVVGVFEDNDGGHELEAGEVDNSDLYILKRDYYHPGGGRDTEQEHARFDGMLAMLFRYLEQRDQLYRWDNDTNQQPDINHATKTLLEDTS